MKRRTFLATGLAVGIAGCNDRNGNGERPSNNRTDSDDDNDIRFECPPDEEDHTYTLEPGESGSGMFQVEVKSDGKYEAIVSSNNDSDSRKVILNA